MKKRILASVVVSLFSVAMFSQDIVKTEKLNVFVPIAKYIEKGDADCLSAWFAENLEINLLGSTSSCSRNQARQILRLFFTDYTPRSFQIVYDSGVYPMKYAVGNLDGGGNLFSVIILVKTDEMGNYIEQLAIEKKK